LINANHLKLLKADKGPVHGQLNQLQELLLLETGMELVQVSRTLCSREVEVDRKVIFIPQETCNYWKHKLWNENVSFSKDLWRRGDVQMAAILDLLVLYGGFTWSPGDIQPGSQCVKIGDYLHTDELHALSL